MEFSLCISLQNKSSKHFQYVYRIYVIHIIDGIEWECFSHTHIVSGVLNVEQNAVPYRHDRHDVLKLNQNEWQQWRSNGYVGCIGGGGDGGGVSVATLPNGQHMISKPKTLFNAIE